MDVDGKAPDGGKVKRIRGLRAARNVATPLVDDRVRRYYLFQACIGFQLWLPFWALWLLQHANYFQATLVDVAFWIVSLLMTVPAGALADRFGRKPALTIGTAVFTIGTVLFGFVQSLPLFALANGIWALGAAFLWSSASAYLFDTLAEAGQEARYPMIVSRAALVTFLASAAACAVAGALVQTTQAFNLPLLVYAIPGAAAVAVALGFLEPGVHRAPSANLVAQIRGGVTTVRASRPILFLIMFLVLVSLVVYVSSFFRPRFIGDLVQGNYALMGLVYAGFYVVAAWAGRSVGRILTRVGEPGALILILCLVFPPFAVMYLVGLGLFSPVAALILGVVAQVFFYVVWGLQNPVATTIINRRVDSHQRATVLSVSTFFTTLSLAFFEPLVGLLSLQVEIGGALAVLAAISVVPAAYALVGFHRSTSRRAMRAAAAPDQGR